VLDRLNETNELALLGGQGAVSWCHRPAKVGHRVSLLDENGPEAERRCIALDDEQLGKVGHGEYGGRRDHSLECRERRGHCVIPREAILFEERCQGRGHRAIVMHELAIVPREPEESTHSTGGARRRPIMNDLHLGQIHGDSCRGDDVAEVGDGGAPKEHLVRLTKSWWQRSSSRTTRRWRR
jgi:hypothetical protein